MANPRNPNQSEQDQLATGGGIPSTQRAVAEKRDDLLEKFERNELRKDREEGLKKGRGKLDDIFKRMLEGVHIVKDYGGIKTTLGSAEEAVKQQTSELIERLQHDQMRQDRTDQLQQRRKGQRTPEEGSTPQTNVTYKPDAAKPVGPIQFQEVTEIAGSFLPEGISGKRTLS